MRIKRWASEADRIIRTSSYLSFESIEGELRNSARYLLRAIGDYYNRLKDQDVSHDFSREVETIRRSAHLLRKGYQDTFTKEYMDSREDTVRRQKAIWRYCYYTIYYVLSLYYGIGEFRKATGLVNDIVASKLSEYVKHRDKMNNIEPILLILDYVERLKMSGSEYRPILRALAESHAEQSARLELTEELYHDIETWESQNVEFMEIFPTDNRELAKEIAAFGTSNVGRIYIGVAKDRTIVGVQEISNSNDSESMDRFVNRIVNIAHSIDPSITVDRVRFVRTQGVIVVRIDVAKGSEPMYYVKGVPYVRDHAQSRPAKASEVKNLHLRHFQTKAFH